MKKILPLILLAFLLAGCGFKPLYVEKKSDRRWFFGNEFDVSINSEMEKVKVESIAEHFGQQLRNELIDLITPKGIPSRPQYRLYVEVVERTVERQALRRDITATREKIMYKVVYYMIDGDKELFRGDSIAYVSYDIMANPYSTTMAQKKAESDATKIIANDIVLRVGAYFHASLVTKDNQSDF